MGGNDVIINTVTRILHDDLMGWTKWNISHKSLKFISLEIILIKCWCGRLTAWLFKISINVERVTES